MYFFFFLVLISSRKCANILNVQMRRTSRNVSRARMSGPKQITSGWLGKCVSANGIPRLTRSFYLKNLNFKVLVKWQSSSRHKGPSERRSAHSHLPPWTRRWSWQTVWSRARSSLQWGESGPAWRRNDSKMEVVRTQDGCLICRQREAADSVGSFLSAIFLKWTTQT